MDDPHSYLTSLMRAYTVANLVAVAEDEFRAHLLSLEEWGHNHDFGTFRMKGRYGNRHVNVLCNFLSHLGLTLNDIQDKDIFDVGCSTGGTALLLAALGNRVRAIEVNKKYALPAQYLIEAFGLGEKITVEAKSLFSCTGRAYRDRFDVAYFTGTIYHLSDPVIGMRIIFNLLRLGGIVLVESTDLQAEGPLCLCMGHSFCPSQAALELMMENAGFEVVELKPVESRLYAIGTKTRQVDMTRRQGFSMPRIR